MFEIQSPENMTIFGKIFFNRVTYESAKLNLTGETTFPFRHDTCKCSVDTFRNSTKKIDDKV